jgi:hypothetical protein
MEFKIAFHDRNQFGVFLIDQFFLATSVKKKYKTSTRTAAYMLGGCWILVLIEIR